MAEGRPSSEPGHGHGLVGRVVCGGQTGVDRAALDAALATGTPYGGWCPRGGLAEDQPEAPGVLTTYPGLRETPDTDPEVRTAWNVRDSDALLVLRLDPAAASPGTDLTLEVAQRLGRPWLSAGAGELARIADWVSRLAAGRPPVLDVAGPRESEDPGVQAAAYATLVALLRRPVPQ